MSGWWCYEFRTMTRNSYDADVAKHEAKYGKSTAPTWEYVAELEDKIAELEKVELETVTKVRKMFVANARKFGYLDIVDHTIQELQSWEKKLKEQGE